MREDAPPARMMRMGICMTGFSGIRRVAWRIV
jgi:hypothetical protein